jgi:hypothetical protein
MIDIEGPLKSSELLLIGGVNTILAGLDLDPDSQDPLSVTLLEEIFVK